ncbi:MAG: AraC family transcriptional regulator [Opitutales bacterium]
MAAQSIPKRLRSARSARVVFGDVIYEPGGTCGPRMQVDYQLVVLVKGAVVGEVDGLSRTVAAGQVGLFVPGHRELFTFAADRKCRHTWCSLSPSLVPAATAAACLAAPRVLPVSRRFGQLMELGLSLPRDAERAATGLVEALGLATLQEYLFSGQRERSPSADEPDALRRAIEWIGLEGHQRVDLRALAGIAGVSPAQLVKLFKAHLDTTPLRYVWEMRTRRGAELLRETGLTVGEVAFRCGFQTPFHFSRWIRQVFGVSPKALRAQAWGRG